MLKQLKLDLKLHGDEILGKLAFPLIGMVIGFVMVTLIVKLAGDGTYICMGSILALAVHIMLNLVLSMTMAQEFMLAMSMGRRRIPFLFSYAVRSLIALAAGYLVVLLCYRLELTLYPIIFPGHENEVVFDFLTQWWMILIAVPGVTLVQMLLGVLYGRFGKPFLTVAYFLWIGGCILLPKAFRTDTVAGKMIHSVVSLLSSLPPFVWMGILVCGIAAMVITIVQVGRKQMVR